VRRYYTIAAAGACALFAAPLPAQAGPSPRTAVETRLPPVAERCARPVQGEIVRGTGSLLGGHVGTSPGNSVGGAIGSRRTGTMVQWEGDDFLHCTSRQR